MTTRPTYIGPERAIDLLRRVWMATHDDHEFLLMIDGPATPALNPRLEPWRTLMLEIERYIEDTSAC
jgi:hypothetical protein